VRVLILSEEDVRAALEMAPCIEAMEQALTALARGQVHNPLRSVVRPAEASTLLGLMPVHRGGDAPAYALKEVVVAPGNPARGLDTHQGAVLLHDGTTGRLTAVVNASAVTAIRTAAVSAVATRALARPGARTVAVVGAGVQGRSHVEAMRAVLGDDIEVRLASRTPQRARALAAQTGASVAAGAEEAVDGADVVCTVTSSAEPVLRRAWLAPGAHVNAVGSSLRSARELDTETIRDAALFVDRRESALAEAGDLLLAGREDPAVGASHIRAELGEVLTGAHPGRTTDDELTVFESLGLAVEDLAAAELAVARAREDGIGLEVEL